MKKHTFVLLSFVPLCCAALLISCSNLLASTGSVNIALPGTGNERSASNGIDCSSSDASYYEVSLSAQSGGDVRTAQGNPGEQISFDSLEPGLYTVTGKAFNSNKVCIAAGTAQASVEAGKSADLSLALYLNTTSSITALTIKSNPTKTTYTVGETFSLDGLSFTAEFNNGFVTEIAASELSISSSPTVKSEITADCTQATVTVTCGNTTFSFSIPLTVKPSVSSISASLKDDTTFTVGTTPSTSAFTVTINYSDNETEQTTKFTATVPDTYKDCCGTIPVTIALTDDTSKTTTVNVTYKYALAAPTVTPTSTAISEAQYTGTTKLSATVTNTAHNYYDATSTTPTVTTFYDTVTCAWTAAGSSSSGDSTTVTSETETTTYTPSVTTAGTFTYTLTSSVTANSSYSNYCSNNSVDNTTTTYTVTVTPWTTMLTDTTKNTDAQSISSGGTVALTASDSYTMSFANASPTEITAANAGASWTVESSSFATITANTDKSGWTFTAPAATASAQSATFTAKLSSGDTNYTLGYFTATVAASTSTTGTTITTYAALETAVKAVTSTSTTTTFILDATTMEATSNIAVTGKVQIIAVSSGCTITRSSSFTDSALFTVVTGGTLILGDSGGSLIIDGGYTSSNTSSTNALISATSSYVTIGTKCTLQNNYNSSTSTKGGGVYCSGTTELTVNGTIKGCYSASNGGGIYAEGTSTSEYVTVAIIDGTITGNSTPVNGGGLYLSKVSATLKGATISNNKATTTTASGKGFGGGIFYSTSSTTLSLTITKDDSGTASSITGNTGGTYGGGVYINYGICNLVNGSISSNITGSSTAATSDCGSNVYCTAYGTYQINGAAKTSGTATAFDDTQTTSN